MCRIFVRDRLARPNVWTPLPTDDHAHVLQTLIARYDVSGNLVPDAHLAALAIQHGLTVCSADTDLARFSEIRWEPTHSSGSVAWCFSSHARKAAAVGKMVASMAGG